MAKEFALAAPTTEEMTGVAMGIAGAGVAGLVEGVVTMMAPRTGALAPFLSWGTLIGMPLVGAAGALFTGGLAADLFKGVASGGAAILGFTLPAMVIPGTARRPGSGGNPGNASRDVKLLGQGQGQGAPQDAQRAAANVGLEI